jgi:hypothetical protein
MKIWGLVFKGAVAVILEPFAVAVIVAILSGIVRML